jgi:hypothetical protein
VADWFKHGALIERYSAGSTISDSQGTHFVDEAHWNWSRQLTVDDGDSLREGSMADEILKQPLTDRFSDALTLACALHRTQARKGTQIPYVSHLLSVAGIALEYGATEDEAIAAVLHDAVEDQGGAPDSRSDS